MIVEHLHGIFFGPTERRVRASFRSRDPLYDVGAWPNHSMAPRFFRQACIAAWSLFPPFGSLGQGDESSSTHFLHRSSSGAKGLALTCLEHRRQRAFLQVGRTTLSRCAIEGDRSFKGTFLVSQRPVSGFIC